MEVTKESGLPYEKTSCWSWSASGPGKIWVTDAYEQLTLNTWVHVDCEAISGSFHFLVWY